MKRPLTPKGIFLGFLLLAMAIASTLLVQTLRPEAKTASTPAAEQP